MVSPGWRVSWRTGKAKGELEMKMKRMVTRLMFACTGVFALAAPTCIEDVTMTFGVGNPVIGAGGLEIETDSGVDFVFPLWWFNW